MGRVEDVEKSGHRFVRAQPALEVGVRERVGRAAKVEEQIIAWASKAF